MQAHALPVDTPERHLKVWETGKIITILIPTGDCASLRISNPTCLASKNTEKDLKYCRAVFGVSSSKLSQTIRGTRVCS
jgi:hypothetical protein